MSPSKTSAGRWPRSDWARLTGHTVEVRLSSEHIMTGVVEQAADDGSVLWISAAGASTRRLFDKPTGYRVLA
ncbi:hypothetical protein [Arthrobacter globiformis]|uniref:hypothetical protein n=1 Tax=Arthrobacter globiformis TaxID=1665 RepID=UPI0027D8119F|nr:hypothetical protein [Arthrobacter globiformis]